MSPSRWVSWDPEPAIKRLQTQVASGIEEAAGEVQRVAQARAPVRKAFKAKRGTVHDLADFKIKIGGGTFTGDDIKEAAGHLGINLNDAQVGQFQVVGWRSRNIGPNNLSWRKGRGEAIRGVGTSSQRTSLGNRAITGFRRRRLPAGVSYTSRASSDIRNATARAVRLGPSSVKIGGKSQTGRGRGIIRVGRDQFQYGGYLRKHIVVEEVQTGDRIVFRVVSKAPYSRYVEFPTSRTAAQPYLLPALKGIRNKFAGYIKGRG